MSDKDVYYMGCALDLARQGRGLTSPNPMVGALLVRDEMIVGQGFYRYADRNHAEVRAVGQAGEKARGATLYVTLEPCSHFGRTAPCCDLVIRSSISRVVAAMQDPNPLVAGGGFRRLREAGIELDVGIRGAEAQRLNESYCKYITTRRPFVTMKAGMTLDGKIASSDGHSRWITSEESRKKAQQLRFEADAILVGIGTLLKDDPWLTDRSQQPRRRPLLRVVLDAKLRTPSDSKLIGSRGDGDIIIFCSEDREASRQRNLEAMGVEAVPLPMIQKKIPFDVVLEDLGRREVASLLIEGGAEINFEALRTQSVDKIIYFISPKILGGNNAVPVVGGEGFQGLEKSLPLTFTTIEKIGPDLMVEAYVNKPSVGGP